MTAEIAILNKTAVALAADSAVTMGPAENRKTFLSGEKIFALSRHQPIAAMFYGNALFMGVPWETIVKIYRQHLGARFFPSLRHYADDFLEFLSGNRLLFPPNVQEVYYLRHLLSYFVYIRTMIVNEVESRIASLGKVRKSEIRTIVADAIETSTPSHLTRVIF